MAAFRQLRLPTSLEHLTKYELCLVGIILVLGIPGFGTAIASIFVDVETSPLMSAILVILLLPMIFFLFLSVLENYRQARILKEKIPTYWTMLDSKIAEKDL